MSATKSKATELVDTAGNSLKEAQRTVAYAAEQKLGETVSAIKSGVADATAGLEKVQSQMKQQMEKAMQTAEELVAFNQGNVEAVMKSGQIWAAGVQDMGKQIAANAQSSFEGTMSSLSALASVRSVREAMDLQASLIRSSMERAMSETGRLTDGYFKLAEQAFAPLTARVSVAVEKFGKAA